MTIAHLRIRSLLVCLALAVGCGECPGEGALGDPCEADGDCASLLCVEGVAGSDGACTQSCGTNEECPEGWSCGAVIQNGVIVCRRGASTPFGQ
jgi:hypothetical protein